MNAVTIRNEFWNVSVMPDASSIELEDLKSSSVWMSEKFLRFHYGKFRTLDITKRCDCVSVSSSGDAILIRCGGFDFWEESWHALYHKPAALDQKMDFTFEIRLAEREVTFVLEPVQGLDQEESLLAFPAKLFRFPVSEKAQVVLPCGYGCLFRFPRKDHFDYVNRYSYDYAALPLFGILRENAGGLGIYMKSKVDVQTLFSIDSFIPGEALLEPSWDIEKELCNSKREMVIRSFDPGDNYIQLAKWYREKVKEEKRFVTLSEKAASSPEVGKMIGSVVWKHNVWAREDLAALPESGDKDYPNLTARQVFDTAHEAGFDRVCVYNTGWNCHGYDLGYPQRLPPNPDRGTAEEFTAAAEYARSLSPDYIFSIHDNYIDTYRESPEFPPEKLTTDMHGIPVPGGLWVGGRAWLICTMEAYKYAQRDLPEIRKMVGRGSIYSDVLGCTAIERCYHKDHKHTRTEDLEWRRKIIAYTVSELGSVATEGAPADYCADVVTMGAYCAAGLCCSYACLEEPPVPVPLFQLVFHDSILNYTGEGCLRLPLEYFTLFQALYNLLPTKFDAFNKMISYDLRGTFVSEMLSFEYTDDLKLEKIPGKDLFHLTGGARSTFSDGTEVAVNFCMVNLRAFGTELPPLGIRIMRNGKVIYESGTPLSPGKSNTPQACLA